MGEAWERGDILYLWLIHIVVWQEPTHYGKTIVLQSKKKKEKKKFKSTSKKKKRKRKIIVKMLMSKILFTSPPSLK